MSLIKHYSTAGAVLALSLLVAVEGSAQKRKKPDTTPAAQTAQLREAEFFFTEGEKYFILEDYAKALHYYQKTLELNPTNATVHYKIADVLARGTHQDDLTRAAVSIEEALRLEQHNKYIYILAASIFSSLTQFDKAAEAYENMIRQVPGCEEYLYELAAVYQYGNRFEDAIKTYNRAEAVFGVNEISSVQKIRLLLEAGKTKDAIAEGEKLMAAFPEEERFVMAFAEVLAKHEQLPLAISFLEKFTTSNENAGNASMLLAGLYRDARQEQKARDILIQVFDNPEVEFGSKIIVLSSYNTEINQNRARRIADPDKESFAMVLYNKLVASHPYDTHVHILGGDLYLSTGHNEEAIEEYKTAIASGDVNFEVWQNLLYLEVQEELYDQVMNDAEKALELFPNQSIIHYFNGYAALHKRKYAEAIFSLEQAKRLSVSEKKLVPEIDSMLGDAYNATRQYEKSDRAYDEALAANPNNYNVLNNYSFFLALRKINLEKAERMSAKLVKDNPDNASYLDTHAWVLYMREKYKEARKTMEKVIGTGQANATHLEHYGDILFKLGDVDGAVQQWERARGMNANSETLNKKIANRKIYE